VPADITPLICAALDGTKFGDQSDAISRTQPNTVLWFLMSNRNNLREMVIDGAARSDPTA
jgi:hypothetical protein